MNISDKQLTALMDWVLSAILYSNATWNPQAMAEAVQKRDEMCAAFGFVCGPNNRPVVPQSAPSVTVPANFRHDAFCAGCGVQIYPGEQHTCATGPTTEHQQAEADADHDNKHEAILDILRLHNSLNPSVATIMRLWPELKAIMEPAPALVSQQPFRHPTFCVSCGVQIFKGEHHECEA